MAHFDAYSATTDAVSAGDLVGVLESEVGLGTGGRRSRSGFHGFGERVGVLGFHGREVGAVSWGGQHGKRCLVEVKGEHTDGVVARLRSACEHRVTRVDSCVDFNGVSEFERLWGLCVGVKRLHRLVGSKAGDWDDFPEQGRTGYLGSASSVCRLRCYEKGKQSEYQHLGLPDWVRVECQVRPKGDARERFSHASAEQVWGASPWLAAVGESVVAGHVDPFPAGQNYPESLQASALRWMVKQYGNHLEGLSRELGGWEPVGVVLGDWLSEQRERRSA